MSLEKYDRFWAVYDGADLVCITVYKKGALEVIRRLTLRGNKNDTEAANVT